MDESDRKTLDDIEKYGCHVVGVMAEDDLPPFAYSVGIQQKTTKPELIVIGLKHELAHSIINDYNQRVVSGEVFEPGKRYAGFIEGFECELRVVHSSHYKEHLGYCHWLYHGWHFKVLQLIYPTTTGVWPWQPEATEWFRTRQPLLDTPHGEGNVP